MPSPSASCYYALIECAGVFHSKLTDDTIAQEEGEVKRLFLLIILAILLGEVVLFSLSNTAISVADTGTRNIEGAWIRNPANGHYYILTEPMPWAEAEAWAQEWGGHLVTLRNWEEELWIKDTFGRDEYFRIGFNDVEQEGNWVWPSGESVVYTNWDEGEPNNCGGFDDAGFCNPEDVAVMNWGSPYEFGDNWNDLPDGPCRGVAEIVPDYVLTISSTAGGSVISPGEGEFPYKDGMVVDLVVEANEGYRFVNWTGDAATIANVNDVSTTVTMNGHYSITANFEPIPEYTLTISSTAGGSVTTPGEGTFTYDEGTVVALVAEPAEGYYFAHWTSNVDIIADVNAAETTITIDGDYEITADFVAQYNLTIDSTDGGVVTTPGEGTFAYDPDTVVEVVATPDTDYRFVNWAGDVNTIADIDAASSTITMNNNCSITANFETVGGCFIASAAYGTPMAEEIQILREFRDGYLLTNSLGQQLVDIYYSISPPIADFIAEHPSLKSIVRAGLMPIVAMCSIVLDIVPQFTGNDA